MEYVSPQYQEQLEQLADRLCTPERYGAVALQGALFELAEVIQLPVREEPPEIVA